MTPEEVIADLAAAIAAESDTDAATVAKVLNHALSVESPPIRCMTIIVTFRWWERPRWLWARRAHRRTDGYMADMRDRLNQTGRFAQP